jgi:hypothetical protein
LLSVVPTKALPAQQQNQEEKGSMEGTQTRHTLLEDLRVITQATIEDLMRRIDAAVYKIDTRVSIIITEKARLSHLRDRLSETKTKLANLNWAVVDTVTVNRMLSGDVVELEAFAATKEKPSQATADETVADPDEADEAVVTRLEHECRNCGRYVCVCEEF